MSRRAPLTTAEKWLFLGPVVAAVLLFVAVSAWKKSRPRFLATNAPVERIIGVANGTVVVQGHPIQLPGAGQPRPLPEIYSFDFESGELKATQSQAEDIQAYQLSLDGKKIVGISWTRVGGLMNYALETRDVTQSLIPIASSSQVVAPLCWISDTQILVADPKLSPVQPIYDAQTLRPVGSMDARAYWPKTRGLQSVLISPDGKRAVMHELSTYNPTKIATPNGPNSIGEVGSRACVVSWPQKKLISHLPGGNIIKVVWTPDSQEIVLLTALYDGSRPLRADFGHFKLATRRVEWVKGEIEPSYSIRNSYSQTVLSPDGKLYVQANNVDNSYTFLSTSTGKIVGKLPAVNQKLQSYLAFCFSPDSKQFLRATKAGVEVWDMKKIIGEMEAS